MPTLSNEYLELTCVEVEEALLSWLLGDGGAIELCQLERLTPAAFFIVRNGWVYAAMLALYERGEEVDFITVNDELSKRGQYDAVNHDKPYLMWLGTLRASPTVRTYAAKIRQMYERRQMMDVLPNAAKIIHDTEKDPILVWSLIRHATEEVRPHDPNQGFVYGLDTVQAHADLLADARQNDEVFEVPFKSLRPYRETLGPGDLLGIIGSTGTGKSAVLYNIAEFYAMAKQRRTLYLFTEMKLKKVLDRRMAKQTGLNYRRFQNAVELNAGEQAIADEAELSMGNWLHKLDYLHAPDIPEERLFSVMLRCVRELGTQVFVIDYLNDVKPITGPGINKTEAYQNLLRRLEVFSNQHNVLIVFAVQRNMNEDKAFMIWQSFDHKVALGIDIQPQKLEQQFAFEYDGKRYTYHAGTKSPLHKWKIRKNRDGPDGEFDMLYVGARFLWTDVPIGFGVPEPVPHFSEEL